MQGIVLLVLLALMFFLLVLRPQRRAKRYRQDMMSRLSEGDEVLTVGGIYGTVADVRDQDCDVEVADGVVLRFDRRAIAQIIRDEPALEPAGEADGADDDPDGEDDGADGHDREPDDPRAAR